MDAVIPRSEVIDKNWAGLTVVAVKPSLQMMMPSRVLFFLLQRRFPRPGIVEFAVVLFGSILPVVGRPVSLDNSFLCASGV